MDSTKSSTSNSSQTPSPSTRMYSERSPPLSDVDVGDRSDNQSSPLSYSTTSQLFHVDFQTPSSDGLQRTDFDGLLKGFMYQFTSIFKSLENNLRDISVEKSSQILELEKALNESTPKILELETENEKLLSDKKEIEERNKVLIADLFASKTSADISRENVNKMKMEAEQFRKASEKLLCAISTVSGATVAGSEFDKSTTSPDP